MKQEYNVNVEITAELYNKYNLKNYVEKNKCYKNCFDIASVININEYKIALCYVDIGLGLWIRHCVFLNDKSEILDFTLYKYQEERLGGYRYKVVKSYTYDEWHKDIKDSYKSGGYRCDFLNVKEEGVFYKREKAKDCFFQVEEYDFYNYILPKLKVENI